MVGQGSDRMRDDPRVFGWPGGVPARSWRSHGRPEVPGKCRSRTGPEAPAPAPETPITTDPALARRPGPGISEYGRSGGPGHRTQSWHFRSVVQPRLEAARD